MIPREYDEPVVHQERIPTSTTPAPVNTTPAPTPAPAPVPVQTPAPVSAPVTFTVYDITPAAPGLPAAVYYTKSTDDPAFGTNADQYDRLTSEQKAIANQWAIAHGIDTKKLSAATNVAPQTEQQQMVIDTSKISREMQVTIPGGDFQQTRDALSKLPNWTPVNLGGDSDARNTFALNGGIVDEYGYPFEGYSDKYAAPGVSPTEADLVKVNEYLNSQINTNVKPAGAVLNPKDITVINPLSPLGGQVADPAYYNKIPVSLRPSPLTHTIEQPAPTPYLGVIPTWVVSDVVALPGNMVKGVVDLGGEAQSILKTDMDQGPIAATGKAIGDFWAFETGLGQSMKSDPARYFYNVGLGVVAGKAIGVGAGIGVKSLPTVSNVVRSAPGAVGSTIKVDNVLTEYAKTTPEYYAPGRASTPFDMSEYLQGGKLYAGLDKGIAPIKGSAIYPIYDSTVSRSFIDQRGVLYKVIDNNPNDPVPLSVDTINGLLKTPVTTKTGGGYLIDLSKIADEDAMTEYIATRSNPASAPITMRGKIPSFFEDESGSSQVLMPAKVTYDTGAKTISISKSLVKTASKTEAIDIALYTGTVGGFFGGNNVKGLNVHAYPTVKNNFNPLTFANAYIDLVNIPSTPKFKINTINKQTQVQVQGQTPSYKYGTSSDTITKTGTKTVDIAAIAGLGVGMGALTYGSTKLLSMGSLGGGAGGSYHSKIGMGMKRGTYKTGDITQLISGKKKRRTRR